MRQEQASKLRQYTRPNSSFIQVSLGGDEMGERGEPVQITRARWSGRGPGARGPRPDYVAYDFVFVRSIIISLTECNTGTTPRVTLVVSTTIQQKNITTISDNTDTLDDGHIHRWMPLLLDEAVTFL